MFLSTLLLLCVIGCTNSFQKPRDGYNTFTDTSTSLPLFNSIMNPPKWSEPYFDISVPNNVTALVGKSAYLSCRVRNLGNKTVSWIRHRDIHILTVGTYTYTTDQRFQTTFHRDINEWTMQIKWAQKRDAGMYECQISTVPIKSYSVRLNVVVPTATILNGPDLYVDKGSTINLTCAIRFSPEPPVSMFWYHQDKVISSDSPRGGIRIHTHKGDIAASSLLIEDADLGDSGKYSCDPSNADVTSIRVHVLNGERPEAMQTGTSTISDQSAHTLILCIIISICNLFRQHIQLSKINVKICKKTNVIIR
ncbi:tyrosine-protein kinase receptor TYRO3-like isoform X2 [Bradysia coprophila]|uniref:tyrosine-protein kinase receptor TYRO3-like isoform X2 n=1 Tax=Bradysia coprophila TaxID=38358 RepID=UPI00187D6F7F|nr:tyrosine-protein kinase receptor TYRO3-like isoform X2 [Bradysia coprophila]